MDDILKDSSLKPPRRISRMSNYKRSSKVEPDDTTFEGSLARLHQIAWGRQTVAVLFHEHSVPRDGTSIESDSPDTVRVLYWGQEAPALLASLRISSVLVREEYLGMLQEILDVAQGKTSGNVQSSDFPVPDLPQKVRLSGAIVVGSPGIGKSTFLIFVLALRVLLGRTTIFQQNIDSFYVINEEGVFSARYPIRNSDNLQGYIPNSTWLLVDSNERLTFVPEEYIALHHSIGCFILQVASPRQKHFDWKKKITGNVPRFWMAPWSLAELIAGRALQSWHGKTEPSELQLISFSQKYGTCPRQAYGRAADPSIYEADDIDSEIGKLSRETIRTLLDIEGIEMNYKVSHLIFVAAPHPGNRRRFTLAIHTKYLTDKILGHLGRTDALASLHLYWPFVTNSHTRSSAGYLLERAFLERFPKGGEWRMTVMEKRPAAKMNTWWHFKDSYPHRFLCLGYQGRWVDITNNSLHTSAIDFGDLRVQRFYAADRLELTDGLFYIPHSKNRPSYDAFIYDSQCNHAIVFKVTVAKEHEISLVDLDWLYRCGVSSVDLVVVTCPLHLDPEIYGAEKVCVPNSHRDKLNEVYHLVLIDE